MYTTQSCNLYEKLFYRPVDAALRWCNLINYEREIIEVAQHGLSRLKTSFPQWPCLHANTEKILDAIQHGELAYGCFGVPVAMGTPVLYDHVTVRHTDLRRWMSRYYPDQRPAFLFENRHNQKAGISIATYLALQGDRDALKVRLESLETAHQQLLKDLDAIGLEKKSIYDLLKSNRKVSDRSESVYLNIIGAMVNLFLGYSPSGKPLSTFQSQAAIVDALTAHYKNVPGITKRTLDEKFAAGKRNLINQ
ncbi:hypothetical protein K7459_21595 [Pseudomonas fluorescens]|uniref:Receptor protein-tyrosine kinase n=1 Tax=Pseudomonas fluorescens (strain Pf0-1) TaxID=205922 RepID=Q3KBX4_PSEPF|nr:hypothetical protein [Pseudomonas fluorescens]ABA74730.1 conserved hypothetical protein [Pseudomonas fluorescens Pf0-1]MBY9026259.1 hypothetical protein [Pseudomonas fluorescens]MBY9030104.1 hypothetical protein [Pseudomonas fluorescens]MBY9038077.1 hypothetical protein [Pseudomonas fluorescens]MBY9044181.1 hypothetical protein [Pseudomonas fluorescens]